MVHEGQLFRNMLAVVLFALLCNALWGSAFPCIKLGSTWFGVHTTADKILYAGLRFTLAGILVIAYDSVRHKHFTVPKGRADMGRVLKLCMFQTVLQYIFFYIGLSNTSGVKASIVEGSNVFVAVVIAGVLPVHISGKPGKDAAGNREDKLTWRILLGCIIGFLGVVLVNLTSDGLGGGFKITGEGFVFFSTFAYGISTVLIKRYAVYSDTVLLSGWQFLFGGAVMTVVGLIAGGTLADVNMRALFMLLYLAFVSAAAYTIWGILLKYNPVSEIAVFGFTNPVFGALLSALLLHEKEIFTVQCAVALLLVCSGIYLVNSRRADCHETTVNK